MVQRLTENACFIPAGRMMRIGGGYVNHMRQRLAMPVRGGVIQRIAYRVRPALEGKEERDEQRRDAAEGTELTHDHRIYVRRS